MTIMNQLFENVRDHGKLVFMVGTTAALGTIALLRLFSRTPSNKREKREIGTGPTGKGKWKLYHMHTFRSARCMWLIEEMKATEDFEIIEYNPYTASPQEREYHKKHVHPHNKVPVMVTSEGDIMIESAAICLYLAQLYGQCLPDEQSEVDYFNWIINSTATIDGLIRALYEEYYLSRLQKDRDPTIVEKHSFKCLDWINHLEAFFKENQREYICENGFTAADVVLGYCVFWVSLINRGMLLSDSKHVEQYLARLKERPLWNKCMGTASEWLNVPQMYQKK